MLYPMIPRQEVTSAHAHQNVNKQNSVTENSVSVVCIDLVLSQYIGAGFC